AVPPTGIALGARPVEAVDGCAEHLAPRIPQHAREIVGEPGLARAVLAVDTHHDPALIVVVQQLVGQLSEENPALTARLVHCLGAHVSTVARCAPGRRRRSGPGWATAWQALGGHGLGWL